MYITDGSVWVGILASFAAGTLSAWHPLAWPPVSSFDWLLATTYGLAVASTLLCLRCLVEAISVKGRGIFILNAPLFLIAPAVFFLVYRVSQSQVLRVVSSIKLPPLGHEHDILRLCGAIVLALVALGLAFILIESLWSGVAFTFSHRRQSGFRWPYPLIAGWEIAGAWKGRLILFGLATVAAACFYGVCYLWPR